MQSLRRNDLLDDPNRTVERGGTISAQHMHLNQVTVVLPVHGVDKAAWESRQCFAMMSNNEEHGKVLGASLCQLGQYPSRDLG